MVFSKGKQLSSKAFVDLVTTRTRASLGAWKLSGGGGGVGTASIAESQGERARVGLGLGGGSSTLYRGDTVPGLLRGLFGVPGGL